MTWVKICGMTNLEDAMVAVEAGADAVGFVFFEKSPRNVSAGAVRTITEKVPKRLEKVGVFVNERPQRIREVIEEAGLTAVQFHGEEYQNPKMYAVPQRSFWCVPAEWVEASLRKDGNEIGTAMALEANLAAIILDSGNSVQRGGTGRAFNWRNAQSIVSSMHERNGKVIVAGGLNPENVVDAIELLKPWGVDVVSGVEASPGKKDPEKVRAFVRAVREYDRRDS